MDPSLSLGLTTTSDERWFIAQRVVAGVALVLLAMRQSLFQGVTTGVAFGLALTPLWITVFRRYRGALPIVLTAVVCAISGIVLTYVTSAGRTSTSTLLAHTGLMLSLIVGLGVVLWSRRFLRVGSIVMLFGFGLLLGVTPTSSQFLSNPWRFGYSIPITVIALGLMFRLGRRPLELVVVLALTAASALSDARSSFAILLLTALLVAFQLKRSRSTKVASAARIVIGVGVLAVVIYNIGQALILDGYLGEKTQARTAAQVDASGSLILGGRPELAATLALIQDSPFGHGAGALPSYRDVAVAKNALSDINYDPNNGYVERYMFGSGFELHSMFGDLWASFGIAGLALAALLLARVLLTLADALARRSAAAIVIYLALRAIWNVPFSPMYGSIPQLTLLLGIALTPVLRNGTRPGNDVPPERVGTDRALSSPDPRSSTAHVPTGRPARRLTSPVSPSLRSERRAS